MEDLELKLGLDKYETSIDEVEDIRLRLFGGNVYMSVGGGISMDL